MTTTMNHNIIVPTVIKDVIEFRPQIHGDSRGYFFEAFRASWLEDCGVSVSFVQQNQSFSQQGVLRGLHYQTVQPQGKLVRALSGEIYDVAVDIRANSATFGQWVGIVLNDQLKNSLWVPAGFAHGFLVMSKTADIAYQCTDYYHPSSEISIHWQDQDLDIQWPLESGDITTSAKDDAGIAFKSVPQLPQESTIDSTKI